MPGTHTPTLERCTTPMETAVVPLVQVVDDEVSIQSLFRSMARVTSYEFVTFGTATDFFTHFDETRPGCLVLDLNLPDRTGIEILQELASRRSQVPVVFMSGMARVSEAVRALKLGSIDFVEKPFDLQVMLEAVHRAVALDLARRSSSANATDLRRRFARLTAREVEVMERIVRGAANKEVAVELGLSPKTVEVHRANVMRKTEADSLAELVRMHLSLHS